MNKSRANKLPEHGPLDENGREILLSLKNIDITFGKGDNAVKAVTDAITEALADGDKVALVGFGTFEVRERAAREGKNPRTGEIIKIAASKVPAFKAGKALKDIVNG